MVGQDNIREDLLINIRASANAERMLEHTFFGGGYGLGKSTAARWVAEQIGNYFKSNVDFRKAKTGSEIKDEDTLLYFIQDVELDTYKILFIDEAHSLPKKLIGTLNTYLDHLANKEPIAGQIHRPVTLIMASEFESKLEHSLRSRCVHSYILEPYSVEGLIAVQVFHLDNIMQNFKYDGDIPDYTLRYIAERSRQVARYAVNYLQKAIKEAQVKNIKELDIKTVQNMFDRIGVGEYGLCKQEQAILWHLYITTTREHAGHPISINSLAEQMSIAKESILKDYEPFLNTLGLISIRKGRTLSQKGLKFVKENPKLKEVYESWRN